MNEVEIQAAGLARGALGVSGESGVDAAQAVAGRIGLITKQLKKLSVKPLLVKQLAFRDS